jgi:hypothetical protein
MTEHLLQVLSESKEVKDFIYDKISKEYTNLPCWVNERMFYQEMFEKCKWSLLRALMNNENNVTFFELSIALSSKTFQNWQNKLLKEAYSEYNYIFHNYTVPNNIVSLYRDNTNKTF